MAYIEKVIDDNELITKLDESLPIVDDDSSNSNSNDTS
jgi:hypothetical protein